MLKKLSYGLIFLTDVMGLEGNTRYRCFCRLISNIVIANTSHQMLGYRYTEETGYKNCTNQLTNKASALGYINATDCRFI